MDNYLAFGIVAGIALAIGRASADGRVKEAEASAKASEARFLELKDLFDQTLSGLRSDSVLLPSLIRWVDKLEEARDKAIELALRTKKRPARKAADELRQARAEGRQTKRELRLALNRLDLYVSLAPWIAEYEDNTVHELIEAMREEAEAAKSAGKGEDPAARFIPKSEWSSLEPSQRNQLALERYCDPNRRRTPWAVGIQYERYIGYTYEVQGYAVQYTGATKGREDLGIDLICESSDEVLIVQCKRLSAEKELPVRENTIAQIFGSASYYRMSAGTQKAVRPVLVTSYRLSDEARRFADHLSVEAREHVTLGTYPMIKCNVSRNGREKIYHLPMDQQYDNVIVGDQSGEFYAESVAEAEKAGFRRAYRWKGSAGAA